MKLYFSIIATTQNILLGVSILMLAILPGVSVFFPEIIPTNTLFFLAHTSLFLVMIIRPLADLLPTIRFIRPLVILRKGVGVFSAAIIVSFILAKIITDPAAWIQDIMSISYWSPTSLAFLAHLADISAILLLVTSNNLSKRLLGRNWKRIQRLSYIYFYGSGVYVVATYQDKIVLSFLFMVTLVTIGSYMVKRRPVPTS